MSYATLAQGNTYCSLKLHTEAWSTATDGDKTIALYQATQIIDSLNYSGNQYDPIAQGTTQFPRADNVIPVAIVNACIEIALSLLDGVDPDLELLNQQRTQTSYANVKSTHDRSQPLEHILAGVPSQAAWRMLRPYLRDSRDVNLVRGS